MRIGIDARSLHREGVGKYIKELLKHLGEIDRENQYCIFVDRDKAHELAIQDNFTLRETEPQTRFYTIGTFLKDMQKEHLDVFHAMDHWYVPVKCSCPVITTFHDLMIKTNPKALKFTSRLYSNIATQLAINISSWIITVSSFNKDEIVRHFKDVKDISVIYNGVSEKFKPLPEKDHNMFRKKYGIDPGYFFYAGSLRKYKNVSTLIKAYADLSKSVREGHELVIAARYEHEYGHLKHLVISLQLEKKVHFVGFLQEEDIINYYNFSTAFIALSLYESFCLPVVEAMACGIPVIVPNNLSFPEITRNTGIFVNALHIPDISRAMETITVDEALRENLIRTGLDVAAQYNWQNNAHQVKEIYEKFTGR